MAHRITDGSIQFDGEPLNTAGAGIVPLGSTGIAVTEYGIASVHKTLLTFTDHAIAISTGDPGGTDPDPGYGGSKVYDMPAGAIHILGATADLTLRVSSAGIDSDWAGDMGVGTATAGVNSTLATTEQNIISTTAITAAVSGISYATGYSTSTENEVIDGTSTAVDVYLNFLVDEDDHDVGVTPCNLVVNGTLVIHWINLGDY